MGMGSPRHQRLRFSSGSSVAENLAALARGFHELPDQLNTALGVAVRLAADEAAAYARDHHPYVDRTGELTNSIAADGPFGSFAGGDLHAVLSAGAAHAIWIEKGTDPHKIRPRFRSLLRWAVEGGYRFAKEVDHPGTKPMPFLAPAVDAVKDRLENELIPGAVDLAFARTGLE